MALEVTARLRPICDRVLTCFGSTFISSPTPYSFCLPPAHLLLGVGQTHKPVMVRVQEHPLPGGRLTEGHGPRPSQGLVTGECQEGQGGGAGDSHLAESR